MSARQERVEGYIEEELDYMEKSVDNSVYYFNHNMSSVAEIPLDSFGKAMIRAIDWIWSLYE